MKEETGAHFGPGNTHRYALWRIWDRALPFIMFIGLNPSTASAEQDDPTIRKVRKFAKAWGYGGIYMCNIFSQVTSDPKELDCTNVCQENDNFDWLFYVGPRLCSDVLFAWGNFKEAHGRAEDVIRTYKERAICLGHNKNGTPKHPLYILDVTKPVMYNGHGIYKVPADYGGVVHIPKIKQVTLKFVNP